MTMDTSSTGSHSDTSPLLVADIGGTNARFALATQQGPEISGPGAVLTLATAGFPDAEALFAEAAQQLTSAQSASELKLAACAIAIAGPVSQGRGQLTNGSLRFDEQALRQALGCPVAVMNDFYAVAASISDSTPVQAVGPLSHPPPGDVASVRAVLGPGTGLGMGYLTSVGSGGDDDAGNRWQVFPSEGGNADFAPVDALELELLGILQRSFATVSIETLVSGRGLPNIYTALCELWGAVPEHTDARQISDAGLAIKDPLSHKTLELFCAMLGTAAGNFALTVGARGGVYLAGGILPRMREFFCASDFRRRFDDRGPLSALISKFQRFWCWILNRV